MESSFRKKADKLTKKAMDFGLEVCCSMSFNDTIDFPMMFGCEAINTHTLCNPLQASVKSYVFVRLPKDANKSEENHNKYEEITSELCSLAKPDYLIGANNGIVSVLMWVEDI